MIAAAPLPVPPPYETVPSYEIGQTKMRALSKAGKFFFGDAAEVHRQGLRFAHARKFSRRDGEKLTRK